MEPEATLRKEIERRRTFAIISHPDAGKTTLTEKLLLYSGAIVTAGTVKGKKGHKAASSDWMAMERERGISVTASAMQFPYKGFLINVLDTPGHEDFSEDTYRTLTAADAAVMVIDASKGVEKQTRKLFEVCSFRKIPVLTFINKMDMPGKDPLDLMDEVERVLGIRSSARNWPIGSGKNFEGVVDRIDSECLLFAKTSFVGAKKADMHRVPLEQFLSEGRDSLAGLQEELHLLDTAGNPFSREAFLRGEVTPVFFGSALTNFGVEPFFDAFVDLAPCPGSRVADRNDGTEIQVDPETTPFSGYVFKIQANMDKRHRDSTAFIRVCSGIFERDLVVKQERLGTELRLSRPHALAAGERETIDKAYPGDVIGVINPGRLAVGDTVSVAGGFRFKPLPKFRPEIFAGLRPKDVGKRKSFDKGILQLSSEGTIRILTPLDPFAETVFAAVGALQFEVMQYRLQDEYGTETILSPLPYRCAVWVEGDRKTFSPPPDALLVEDESHRLMALFLAEWDKEYAERKNPDHKFLEIIV